MMIDVYLTDIKIIFLPNKIKTIPRERFVRYYEDLYRLYNKKFDYQTFSQGGQYSFAELGDELLKKNPLENLNLFIAAHWSHEFDPDYSHCVSYFQEHYFPQINCFDVTSAGSLTLFSAIHLAKNMLSKTHHQKGIVLGLEQNTIPRNLTDKIIIPTKNAACTLLLSSSHFQLPSLKIIHCEISNKKTIINIIAEYQPEIIFIKKNSSLPKKLNAFFSGRYQFFSAKASIMMSISSLVRFIKKSPHFIAPIAIIEEDLETTNIGVLLLESRVK